MFPEDAVQDDGGQLAHMRFEVGKRPYINDYTNSLSSSCSMLGLSGWCLRDCFVLTVLFQGGSLLLIVGWQMRAGCDLGAHEGKRNWRSVDQNLREVNGL